MAKRPLAATAADYVEQFRRLLPPGPIWSMGSGDELHGIASGQADEAARIHGRVLDLLNTEADPRTTSEMLDAWERNWGLPEHCMPASTTDAERRARLAAKVAAQGGQSQAYYEAIAFAFGITLTSITEPRAFRAGDRCAATGTVEASLQGRCWSTDWHFVWIVNAPAQTVTVFRANDNAAGDRVRYWGSEGLECLFNKYRPAHTIVVWIWGP